MKLTTLAALAATCTFAFAGTAMAEDFPATPMNAGAPMMMPMTQPMMAPMAAPAAPAMEKPMTKRQKRMMMKKKMMMDKQSMQ